MLEHDVILAWTTRNFLLHTSLNVVFFLVPLIFNDYDPQIKCVSSGLGRREAPNMIFFLQIFCLILKKIIWSNFEVAQI